MDADCLIKLTKAGLKELVAHHNTVTIPQVVWAEVVVAGKVKGMPDALVVEENVNRGVISLVQHREDTRSGDRAIVVLFDPRRFDAVATDDARLARLLRSYGIPFVLPAMMIHRALLDGELDLDTAKDALRRLAPFISEEECGAVRVLMEARS
ncbi:MAG: hypothetical protein AB1714_10395 [Acidobacteriota bacterium]